MLPHDEDNLSASSGKIERSKGFYVLLLLL